jgi:hypothetical protein
MKQRGQNGTLMINCSYKRSGYFKKDRFKSVIVDRKETLVNSFAYIDLNPLCGPEWKNNRENTVGTPSATTCKPTIGIVYYKYLFASKHNKIPKQLKAFPGSIL